jgi:hypothetical protein
MLKGGFILPEPDSGFMRPAETRSRKVLKLRLQPALNYHQESTAEGLLAVTPTIQVGMIRLPG